MEYFKNDISTTIYNYNSQNLLVNLYIKSNIDTARIVSADYVYNKKKKVIKYTQSENDKVYFTKKISYDNYGNKLQEEYIHTDSYTLSKYKTDYKKRAVIILSYDKDTITKKRFLKFFYDKKGILICIENTNDKLETSRTIKEYDSYGNYLK